jgi:hypothetical protein
MKKRKETIFCIAVAIVTTALYMSAGAIQRGWIDWPGTAALLVLIAPLTLIWIKFRTADKDE